MTSFSFQAPTRPTPRHSRHTLDYEEDDFTGPNFLDHFSLREPSSTVKFRGARVHVYEASNEQILLEDRRSSRDVPWNYPNGEEEDDDDDDDDDDNGKRKQHRHNITVKRMPWGSFGLTTLRMAYTLVTLLLLGNIFALSFQIILFLFVKLAADGRLAVDSAADVTTTDYELTLISTTLIGTILSTPVFLFGFSSMMAIATTFVSEAWSGGNLIRAVIGAPTLLKEIMYFVSFIMVPAITFITALFLRLENPWEITCYAWLGSVTTTFCFFGLSIVWCEVAACFRLISLHYCKDSDGEIESILQKTKRAILLIQMIKYAGSRSEQYLVSSDDVAPEGGYTFDEKQVPAVVKMSIYARITQLGCLRCMFEVQDPPKRTYSIEEVRDVLPFITTHTWSLETMFCTSTRQRMIIAAKGPAAVERSQILASAVCNIVGTLLITATFIGYLFWMEIGLESYIFVGALCVVFSVIPLILSNMEIFKMYTDINKKDTKTVDEEGGVDGDEKGGADSDEGIEDQKPENARGETDDATMFRLWETSRVTRPKNWLCYTGLVLEFGFLFVWPIATLFRIGSWPIALVFVVLSFFSFLRKYFDASAILCELGSLNAIDIEKQPGKESSSRTTFLRRQKMLKGAEKTMVRKARLADVVGCISRNGYVDRWMWFFGILVLFTLYLYTQAVTSGDGLGDRPPIVMVNDYEYVPEKSLQYPSCSMSKGFRMDVDGVSSDTSLGDYAFLSAMAYETTNVTRYTLPQWFGGESVVDEDELVKEYRAEAGNANVPVSFKFFTFSDDPQAGLLSIRGSQTSWDWMVNFQLWSASGLAQFVKWATPYGWIWTPVLDDLVTFIGFIQTEQLKDISYYKVTTAFTNQFKEKYSNMQITGASLGGGLAIITGAQARVPAVAISGLGAELSRNTLTPRISVDDINKYAFNFIPDRDYIARIGGRPRQNQEAQCNASYSNLFGCHSMWRSACEINYRCGSNGRPVICRCHFNFGYPEPEPIGTPTRTFREACEQQEQVFLGATGSGIASGWWTTDQ